MFGKNLADTLLRFMNERKLTLEDLSEACNLSTRFLGSIIRRKASPSLDSFEKICAALEATPNELLLSKAALDHLEKSEPKRVTKILNNTIAGLAFPICPSCGKTMERDYQSYCDRCGQFLSWKGYWKAEVITKA